jgi:hypothetical protein
MHVHIRGHLREVTCLNKLLNSCYLTRFRTLNFTRSCSINETAVRAYAAERLSDASGPSALNMAQALLPAFNVSVSSIRLAEVTRVNVVATHVQVGEGLTLQAWLLNVSLTALLVRGKTN